MKIWKQLNLAQIARREREIRIFLMIDQQHLAIKSHVRQQFSESLRLVILQRECVDDIQLVLFELECESGLQSGSKHLSWQPVFVIPRLRPENRTALAPKRIADFADAGTPCALLLPGFSTAAGNFCAGFRLMCAAAMAREVLLDGQMHQSFVNRTCENFIRKVQLADNLVLQVFDVYACHI